VRGVRKQKVWGPASSHLKLLLTHQFSSGNFKKTAMSTLLDPASSLPTLVALLYPYTPNPSTFVSTALKVIGEASKKDLVDTFLSQDTLSCIYENVLSGAKKENIQECETQLANAVPNLVEREGGVLTGEDLKSAFAVVFGVLDGEATGEVAKRLGTGDEKR